MRKWLPLLRRPSSLRRYFPEAIEQHLRELGLSPYPAEEQQRDGRQA